MCANAAHRDCVQKSINKVSAVEAVGDRLLNIVELAEVLGVSVATIYDWRYQGCTDRFPPTVRLGSALRWRASDVRKFLSRLEAQ